MQESELRQLLVGEVTKNRNPSIPLVQILDLTKLPSGVVVYRRVDPSGQTGGEVVLGENLEPPKPLLRFTPEGAIAAALGGIVEFPVAAMDDTPVVIDFRTIEPGYQQADPDAQQERRVQIKLPMINLDELIRHGMDGIVTSPNYNLFPNEVMRAIWEARDQVEPTLRRELQGDTGYHDIHMHLM